MALAAIRLAFLAAGVALAIAAPAAAQERAPVDRKTMEAWARVLDTDDPARVVEAVEKFNATGPEAIPVLIGVVQKGTDLGATHACGLLASKGDEALVAVPAIEEAITRRDERYLRHAARALWKMGVRPEKSLASLRALAKTGDAAGTALVWRITGQEGNLRPILEHDARSPHLWQRAIAVDVLVAFGPTAGKEFSFPLALLLARDAKEWVRGRALRVLTAVDPRARESIAEYEFACRDSDRAVRFEALRGLVAAGFSTPGVLPALARSGQFLGNPLVPYQESALLSGSLENREEVVAALAPLLANEDLATRLGAALISNCLGSKTSDVARVLADGLGTDEFRPACLSALTALGEPAAAVVRDIAALLTDADQPTAMGAAALLLAIGKPGAAAAPAVAASLEDSRPALRKAAANLLLTVYGTGTVPGLEERLKGLDLARNPEAARVLRKLQGLPDDTPPVPKRDAPSKASIESLVKELREGPVGDRQLILRRIASVGPEASAALPTIRAILDDPADSISRRDALIALAAVAPTDPKTAEKIGPYLIGRDGGLKSAAVQALVHLGPHQPRAAVVYLLDSVERDPELRLEASMALARIGTASVEFLRGRLGHADPEVRLWLIRSLGEIGPAARDAVPDIEKACEDADKRVQDAAAKALKKIRGN